MHSVAKEIYDEYLKGYVRKPFDMRAGQIACCSAELQRQKDLHLSIS